MSKRKLSKQQVRRIAQIHIARQKRAEYNLVSSEQLNDLGAEQSGVLIVRFGKNAIVSNDHKKDYICHFRQNLTAVTGDHVIWRAGKDSRGVITAIQPRKTVLNKTDKHGHTKAIAANITKMVIVIAPSQNLVLNC